MNINVRRKKKKKVLSRTEFVEPKSGPFIVPYVRGNSFKLLTYLKTTIVITNENKYIYLYKKITEGGSVFNKNI